MINFYMGGIRQGNMLSLMHDGYLHVCRDAQASGMEIGKRHFILLQCRMDAHCGYYH